MADNKPPAQSADVVPDNGLVSLYHRASYAFLWRFIKYSKQSMGRVTFATCRYRAMRDCRDLLPRNETFRDRHRGRRCFIIGNGPSLKAQALSRLTGEVTFATNSFYLHPLAKEQRLPTYYLLSDPQYFDGSTSNEEFAQMRAAIGSKPIFLPHYAREFITSTNALPSEQIYYVATCGGLEDTWQTRPDLTQTIPGAQTVVQLAMLAAMYMGCSPIYLLGLDHDWLSHGGKHLNFYSDETVDEQPEGNLPGWTYRRMMEAMLTMWDIYEMLLRIANAEGIEIINATHGGFLDVFKRQRYESILNDANLK
jgi:6-hydroxymethylpterin diphosphokinase MptE-like